MRLGLLGGTGVSSEPQKPRAAATVATNSGLASMAARPQITATDAVSDPEHWLIVLGPPGSPGLASEPGW